MAYKRRETVVILYLLMCKSTLVVPGCLKDGCLLHKTIHLNGRGDSEGLHIGKLFVIYTPLATYLQGFKQGKRWIIYKGKEDYFKVLSLLTPLRLSHSITLFNEQHYITSMFSNTSIRNFIPIAFLKYISR